VSLKIKIGIILPASPYLTGFPLKENLKAGGINREAGKNTFLVVQEDDIKFSSKEYILPFYSTFTSKL
jgi:hypothetical protein